MNVRRLVSAACLVLAFASAAAASFGSAMDGDDDGFGGTQGTNSNPGDPFTPFASPTLAPGSHYISSGFHDRTTVAPWTPYFFENAMAHPGFEPSHILSATLGFQIGGVARRADDTGFGHATVTLIDLFSTQSVVLGDLLEVDTGAPDSAAENQVRLVEWDIYPFLMSLPSLDTLLLVHIDGTDLTDPGDQFSIDFLIINWDFIDGTSTTSTTEGPTTSTTTTAEPTTTTTIVEPEALCGTAPRTGCFAAAAGKASVQLSSPADPAKRKLKFKWKGGDAVPADAFGDPVASDDPQYRLCVYDASARPQPLLETSIPSGPCGAETCWKPAGPGFKYKNKAGMPDGIAQVQLKPGDAGKAQLKVGGKGGNLPLPELGLSGPVVVQFVADDGTGVECWQTSFSTAKTSDAGSYKAKGP